MEVDKIFSKIDQNKSGKIDFHEFLICMARNKLIITDDYLN
jgi:Ca2+-binding EF-hand superfamily protein